MVFVKFLQAFVRSVGDCGDSVFSLYFLSAFHEMHRSIVQKDIFIDIVIQWFIMA